MARQSVRERMLDRFFGDLVGSRTREAYASGRESGEDEPPPSGYSRYGYQSGTAPLRDLSSYTQDEVIGLAFNLWGGHPYAKRFTEMMVDFTVGGGVKVSSDSDEVQLVIDTFWDDSVNDFPGKLGKRARELSIFGEQVYEAFVNDADGKVRIGAIDPGMIAEVVKSKDNAEVIVALRLKPLLGDADGQKRLLKVIAFDGSTGRLEGLPRAKVAGEGILKAEGRLTEGLIVSDIGPARERLGKMRFVEAKGDPPELQYDGECFYFRVNDISTGARGRPDLLAELDWLRMFDVCFWGFVEWAALIRSFVYHVTLKNATEAELRKRNDEIGTPKPGSVIFSSDREIWEAVNPSLQSADFETLIRQLRILISGGLGVPEHYLGEGGTVNRATAAEMGVPTMKMFESRQTYIQSILHQMVQFAVDQAVAHGTLAEEVEILGEDQLTPVAVKVRDAIDIVMPPVVSKDMAEAANAFGAVVQGLVAGRMDGLVPDRVAYQILAAVANQLGVEVDVEQILKEQNLGDYAKTPPPIVGRMPPPVPLTAESLAEALVGAG